MNTHADRLNLQSYVTPRAYAEVTTVTGTYAEEWAPEGRHHLVTFQLRALRSATGTELPPPPRHAYYADRAEAEAAAQKFIETERVPGDAARTTHTREATK